ncbi:uracil-DNA glycosylase [Paenibacillus campi]|uniref:uracil-DNA glycosylase n=1 Tax=Paenibacillus campi TaxID=3106031 RepID=UPI002AFF568E|nr:uracil-DNA glycosylase [Paenibacillus sp. SGZ-1009]
MIHPHTSSCGQPDHPNESAANGNDCSEHSFHIGHVPLPPELVAACRRRVEHKKLEGFLAGFGKWPGDIMLVGEAPGGNEIVQGRPFCGQAGKVLDEYLHIAGITRDDLYMTSAVRSRPYRDRPVKGNPERISRSNRTPTASEIVAHAPILDYELAVVQPRLLITVGNIGLQRLLGNGMRVSDLHGQPRQSVIRHVERDHPERGYYEGTTSYWIFPLYHPAAILYNRALETVIEQDLHHLRNFLQGDVWR